MRSAYNEKELYHLMVLKDVKNWWKHKFIGNEQYTAIKEAYVSNLYHPNFLIRILLFMAGLLALSGASGLFFLFVASAGEGGISISAMIFGIGSFVFLKYVFIDNRHYKSGITEAVLYHSIGFTLGGFMVLTDFNVHLSLIASLVVLSFAAIRYLDLLCTLCAVMAFAGLVFFECYNLGGTFRQIIPFTLIAAFILVYFITRRLKVRKDLQVWRHNLLAVESASLLLIYLGGNYLVVRELSVLMMDMVIEEGGDIPFAFIFYALTILIPAFYLFLGLRNKDIVLIRVSLIVVALSVLTFKYYYSFNHPEITLTVAGAILLAITMFLFNFLKTPRGGFTRENLLSEKWAGANIQAFVVSQTLGGNQVKTDNTFKGGGGQFGGGGASGSF